MVSVGIGEDATYPAGDDSYSPSENYPEYGLGPASKVRNSAYSLVREALRTAGLDRGASGTPAWNPLADYLRPGQTVFLLCNLVYHRRPSEPVRGLEAKCTHGSVVRAVADYALKAVGRSGRVFVGCAPLQSCDWDRVLSETGVGTAVSFHREHGCSIEARDLRLRVARRDAFGRVRDVELRGDGEGVEIDLGGDSLLAAIGGGPGERQFRVSDYDPRRTESFHNDGSHRYVIHRAILESDAIISLPKLKTHEKVGITCVLKGLVGTVAHKDCLAHHRFGNPGWGGDEYPDRFRFLRPLSHFHDWVHGRGRTATLQGGAEIADRTARRITRRLGLLTAGAWHGNDTAWRMTLDLARIAHYADAGGIMRDTIQRTHLALIDGIVGGEGQGPLSPTPYPSRCVIFADGAVDADLAACRLMGYDPSRIPLLARALDPHRWPLPSGGEGGSLMVNGAPGDRRSLEGLLGRPFRPPAGWCERLTLP